VTKKRAVVFIAIAFLTLALDQGSKAWAQGLPVPAGCTPTELAAQHCAGTPVPVIHGFWDWQLEYNTGVAFSTFAHASWGHVALSILAVLALIAIGFAASRTQPEQRLRRVAFALIAGGALGNLLDRVRSGWVTDFVHWHVGHHDWPVFNVADVALLVGIAMLLLERAPEHVRNLRGRRAPAVS
jgi:signal peptidase II